MSKGVYVGIGIAIVAIIAVAAISLSQPTTTPTTTAVQERNAALVMEAPIDDLGWGYLHYQGMLALEEKLGYEIAISELQDPPQWETAARDYAERGYKYVIMGGPEFTDLTAKIAPEYPETTFIVAAAIPPFDAPYPSNMVGLDGKNEQSGYLAGVLAGAMTKTNKVGIVAAFDFPNLVRMYEAFKLGVQTENPQAEILQVYIGSFNDVALGYEATKGQIDAGADIIFQDLDRAAFGVINGIKESPGVLHFGNTNDQVFLDEKLTPTSALFNFKSLILRGVEELDSGKIKGGEFYSWGIKEGITGLAPYHEFENQIPSALKAKIEGLKNQMIEGTFVVPEIYDEDGYKEFLKTQLSTLERNAALVMDGSTDDVGWGLLHDRGMLALRDQLGYEIAVNEKVPPPQWETAPRHFAELGYKYVILGGGQFTDIAIKIAPEYPKTTFLVTAAVPPIDKPYPPNMVGIDLMNEQSGYLAGVLAAGMTKTNKVGAIGGIDFPYLLRWNEAFKLAVLTQNPSATVYEVYTGSFEDVTKGYEAAKGQMDAGADVIWQNLDLGGAGVVNAIKETPGVWLISNTDDQYFLAPEVTLSSTLQNMTKLIVYGVEGIDSGKIKGGEYIRLGVGEGAAGLAPYHETEDKIPPALKSKIEELKKQMMEGTFEVPLIYEQDGYKKFLKTQVSTQERKAALVMDASIDDIGWGTSHHQGLLALKDKMGYEIALSEKVPPAEWETAARDYAERGYKYVIMGGAQFTDVTAKIAPDYPKTTFLVVTAVPPIDKPYPPNMIGLDLINEQSGYLAGVLAGGMTKTNKVGIVAGIDYPNVIRWNEAFKLGVLTQNPQATILEVFTGSWDDVSKGYEATKGQMDVGADVIWQYLDLGAVGVANAVKEKPGVWLISNTNDQSFLAPEITLTSALQGITSLIPQGVEAHEAGKIKGGEFYRWGVKEGVAGLAPYHEIESKIPSALKAKIEELKNQMIEGTFVVPEIYDKDGYKEFLKT